MGRSGNGGQQKSLYIYINLGVSMPINKNGIKYFTIADI
jgi:predicted transcriptional regulator with HTH domain